MHEVASDHAGGACDDNFHLDENPSRSGVGRPRDCGSGSTAGLSGSMGSPPRPRDRPGGRRHAVR
jgi:hypothetical protein